MNTTQQIRAGCYLRISSDPKDRRAGVTRQREDTTDTCRLTGWVPVKFYEDNDKSASNGKARPRWAELLADIEAGEINAVVVWNQDRAWRTMADFESLRPVLAPRGVLLATTNMSGAFDFNNADDIHRMQVSTANSEHEIAKMKMRMCRAGKSRAESGKPQWRKAFGYIEYTGDKRDDDGTRELDPKSAPLVTQAYRALLAGHTLNDIAAIFNDTKAYGINGKPWSASTVSLFLRAPRNAGLRDYNGQVVGKGTWEPLIKESTWRAAQDKLSAPGRAPGKKSVQKHLLTGVLQCGRPGCDGHLGGMWSMQRTGGKPGRPKQGATHPGQRTHSIVYSCKGCHRVGIRGEHVEPLLYAIVGERLARPDAVDLLKAEVHDEAQAEATRLELHTLYGELDSIGRERGEGLLTGQQAKIASDIVGGKIKTLEHQQQDQERLRVFEDLPLATPEVVASVKALSPDRFRAVVAVLLTATVEPVGKGHRVNGERFDPRRLRIDWK